MNTDYKIEGVWAEVMKRLSDEALQFITEYLGPDPITWGSFENTWYERNPGKSMFISGYIPNARRLLYTRIHTEAQDTN